MPSNIWHSMRRVRRLELRQYKKKLKSQEPQVEPVQNLLEFFIKMNHKKTLTEAKWEQ
jgi:hypothetical protein